MTDLRCPARPSQRRRSLSAAASPLLACLLLAAAAGCRQPRQKPGDFARERAAHPTHLVRKGQAPMQGADLKPVEWLEVFEYQSGPLPLRGYRAFPKERTLEKAGRVPGLLYLHGGFALARQDVLDTLAVLRQGFALYAPAYRGENGNPGYHELFYGELEDARAALDAMRKDPRIDARRLFVFGHSAGGVLAALLTLDPQLHVRDTGSVGGIYQGRVFDFLDLPFRDTEEERRLRLFVPHMRQMTTPHFACVGRKDPAYDATLFARSIAQRAGLPFTVHEVPGDHLTALQPCLKAYTQRALDLLAHGTPPAGR